MNQPTLNLGALFLKEMKQTFSVLKSPALRIFDEKYILSFSIMATCFNFCYCPFSFFVLHNTLGAIINGASSVLLAIIIYSRRNKWIGRTTSENLLLSIAYLTMFSLSYRSGGLTSAIVPWYIVINMFSLTVNNKKVAIFWTLMALFSIAFFWIAEAFFDYRFPNDYSGNAYYTWFFVVIVGVFLLGIKIVGVIEERNAEFIETLTEKNLELQKSKEEIEHLQHYKENFLANITHELRTPLNAIKSISELLKMENSDFEKNEMIDGLNKSSNHLLNMINDVLDFSKLKEGKLILRQQSFVLEDCINTACRLMKINANDKGLAFVLHKKSLPKNVIGDESRLIQMMVNIIGNAIKFTTSGSIKVDCSAEYLDANKCTVRIKISDTGMGISDEKIKSIFDDYVQADENIAAKFGGTGLGLGITKRLVELHHGSIECESKLNLGTCFTIYLPFEFSENENETTSNDSNFEFIKSSEIKILVVDDNKMNLFVAEKLIEKSLPLAKIYKAENGFEALDFIAKNKVDIILMDMKMPQMDGPTAAFEIRKIKAYESIQIIAMTAATSDAEINECLQSGMNDYISKPFYNNELLSKIQLAYHKIKDGKMISLN
ncbi:MAG: hypothetical protein RIQ33_175 [Bacteroidota bacterium]|jgi:signal transduction histidine kinase/CheY-like chemotaxis protein